MIRLVRETYDRQRPGLQVPCPFLRLGLRPEPEKCDRDLKDNHIHPMNDPLLRDSKVIHLDAVVVQVSMPV